jgi:hypothetical protein
MDHKFQIGKRRRNVAGPAGDDYNPFRLPTFDIHESKATTNTALPFLWCGLALAATVVVCACVLGAVVGPFGVIPGAVLGILIGILVGYEVLIRTWPN